MLITGSDTAIAMSAIVWLKDCPFSRATKPSLVLSEEELEHLYDLFSQAWLVARDNVGVEGAKMTMLDVQLTSVQLDCLKQCLIAALDECTGNKLELEIRVGTLPNVQSLLASL
jgi:hypothetical protein